MSDDKRKQWNALRDALREDGVPEKVRLQWDAIKNMAASRGSGKTAAKNVFLEKFIKGLEAKEPGAVRYVVRVPRHQIRPHAWLNFDSAFRGWTGRDVRPRLVGTRPTTLDSGSHA